MPTMQETKTKSITIKVATIIFALGTVAAIATFTVEQIQENKITEMMIPMKTEGCAVDGVLNNYQGNASSDIALVKRSKCKYIHRAIETWTTPPNFNVVRQNLSILGKEYIYGMFIAEAIGVNSVYYYPDEKRNFNFPAMCRGGSDGMWGPGTCKANLASQEYQKYVTYITKQAIDLGIQSFLFGQIHFQDPDAPSVKNASGIVSAMRRHALFKGKTIIIGAQTNDIADEKYLKLFDYIEGGVGIDGGGEIEDKPCSSHLGSCWALLWHKNYASKAKNVFLHLDWSGLVYDDMSKFARMRPETRAKTLQSLYSFFTGKNMAFIMPMSATLYDQNGGCYGSQPKFYSASNSYSCKDESIINNIISRGGLKNDAQYIGEQTPSYMIAGEKYPVSVTIKNVGNSIWSGEKDFNLGSQNPQDNFVWGKRVALAADEKVFPGQEKTFDFIVTAPAAPENYNFQWQMVQESKEWFGTFTENLLIPVIAKNN